MKRSDIFTNSIRSSVMFFFVRWVNNIYATKLQLTIQPTPQRKPKVKA
jgi:hypothetical protein